MPGLSQLIEAWDEGNWELSEAFVGLPDAALWVRPHPRLLSVGELAGHIAYWDAVWITGEGMAPDVAALPIRSPLIDPAFRYYSTNVEAPVALDLGAEQAYAELDRVHREAKAALLRLDPSPADAVPAQPNSTWEGMLRYRVFHVAYHTGQIYSVRHLLGHSTKDN